MGLRGTVLSGLHPVDLQWSNEGIPQMVQNAAVAPTIETADKEDKLEGHSRLFHVVLLDDDEHTYDYVVEMLQKLFVLSLEKAFQCAVEVDTAGRTVVITCERSEAEFGRDQIHAYGADPRMPKSKGSMSAVLVPAGVSKVS